MTWIPPLLPEPQKLLKPYDFYPANLSLAETYKQQGNWYSQQGDLDKAQALYESALKLDPQYTDAWYNLGTLHKEQQHWPQAVSAYSQVVALTPQDTEAWLKLGECYENGAQPVQAHQAYDAVLKFQPTNDVAQRKRAYIRFNLLAQLHPKLAERWFYQLQQKAFQQAKNELVSAAQQGQAILPSRLSDVNFRAGLSNPNATSLAEYDASTDSIQVKPELVFSDKKVLASYMAHEYVHAADQDNKSDVNEEIRGYLASIAVWQFLKGDLIEPNLDYAVQLSEQGLPRLAQRIREVYTQEQHLVAKSLSSNRR